MLSSRVKLVKQRFDEASLAHGAAARIVETTVVGYVSLERVQRRHGHVTYVDGAGTGARCLHSMPLGAQARATRHVRYGRAAQFRRGVRSGRAGISSSPTSSDVCRSSVWMT